RVYKLKKQIRFDFLDFSTLARREQACRDEVRLNRRLAPQTYLGVTPVLRDARGGWLLGSDDPQGEELGEVEEWLVEMRRLPLERSLDRLIASGELTPELVDELADVLAAFYQ